MKFLYLAAAAALAITGPAAAKSAIDGTWKVDVKSAKMPSKPTTTTLANGMYYCGGCSPSFTVKADGKFHKVIGQPYADEVMIKVVDASTIEETDKKGGKVTYTVHASVSADGKTKTYTFADTSADNGVAVKGTGTSTRVAAGPKGSHAVSGDWKRVGLSDYSDAGATVTYKTDGDMLMMTTPTGLSYAAKFGGPAVPIKGDPGKIMAAVAKKGSDTFMETDSHDGKEMNVATMVVAKDGKTMTIAVTDSVKKTTATYKAMKQ